MKLFKTTLASAAVACLGLTSVASAQTILSAGGWLESAFVEWSPVSGATSYNVYYSGNGASNVKIDAPLVRSYGDKLRADVLGLKAGSYTLKVAPVVNGKESAGVTTSTLAVSAQDRAGFAFHGSRVPGAYNSDGSLKSGAVVIYITEKNKNNVTLDVTMDSKGNKSTCGGFQGILTCMKKGFEKRPVDFRLVGTITDPEVMDKGDILVDLGSSATTYLTIEGVGEDAVVNGWGIRIKNSQNVEVRNLGVMNVNSGEGDNIGLQQDNQYVWVHNNDLFYGDAGSDADQVKGDGALDCKKSTYVTFSYNHFWDNGKSNLLGLSEGTTDGLYITYHHNWYDHSDSRHPRVRFYSAHVYNNYYDGNAKYGIGSTLGSSVFAEANYFRNCKYPMLTSLQGSDVYAGGTKRNPSEGIFSGEAGGSIKAFNNYIEGGTFIPYGASSYTLKGKETALGGIDSKKDFDAYVITSRDQSMPSTVTSYSGANKYNNFDLDKSIMYSYKAEEPAAAKASVMKYAGRVNGGDFKWTFNNATDDEKYAVDQKLKSALVGYKTTLKSVQGEGNLVIIDPSPVSSSTVNPASSSAVSSSAALSSGSVASSSSVKPASSSEQSSEVAGDEVHNFTASGLKSDFYAIEGNLSTSKGSVTYEGSKLTQCLKMESSTKIGFEMGKSGTLTLVLNEGDSAAVKVDGNKVKAVNGVVSVKLAAGAHEVLKADQANLFLMKVTYDVSENPGSVESSGDKEGGESDEGSDEKGDAGENSGSDKDKDALEVAAKSVPALRYNAVDCRLEIFAKDVRRLDVIRMDGRKASLAVAGALGTSVDLSHLQSGAYMIRLVTRQGIFQQRITVK